MIQPADPLHKGLTSLSNTELVREANMVPGASPSDAMHGRAPGEAARLSLGILAARDAADQKHQQSQSQMPGSTVLDQITMGQQRGLGAMQPDMTAPPVGVDQLGMMQGDPLRAEVPAVPGPMPPPMPMPRPPEESPMPMRSRPSMSAVPRGGLPAGMMGGGVVSLPTNMSYSGGGIVGYANRGKVELVEDETNPAYVSTSAARAAERELDRAKLFKERDVELYYNRLQKTLEGKTPEQQEKYLSGRSGMGTSAEDKAISLHRERREPEYRGVPEWMEGLLGGIRSDNPLRTIGIPWGPDTVGFGPVVQEAGQPILSVSDAKEGVAPARKEESQSLQTVLKSLEDSLKDAPNAKVPVIQAKIKQIKARLAVLQPGSIDPKIINGSDSQAELQEDGSIKADGGTLSNSALNSLVDILREQYGAGITDPRSLRKMLTRTALNWGAGRNLGESALLAFETGLDEQTAARAAATEGLSTALDFDIRLKDLMQKTDAQRQKTIAEILQAYPNMLSEYAANYLATKYNINDPREATMTQTEEANDAAINELRRMSGAIVNNLPEGVPNRVVTGKRVIK